MKPITSCTKLLRQLYETYETQYKTYENDVKPVTHYIKLISARALTRALRMRKRTIQN